ncbi:hypothetical protein [Microbacterium sp.]|uniref:hypothetical protein n=1 Tax=Microbacterium sp. TaxID=51671 RepID=UPI0028123274|nr:hypothetical protein [Microbacterium sp.]
MDSSTAAFGPASLVSGAILPARGRDLMLDCGGLPPGATEASGDGWLAPDVPVLVRGDVRILPLAWRGDPSSGYNPYAEPGQLKAFASRMQDAGMHRAGPWAVMDLSERRADSIGSYTEALRSSGATKANRWVFPEGVGVALVWAGDEAAGDWSLAVHVVPASWVSERLVAGPVEGIDVTWSWADVIRLDAARADADASAAAGSLAAEEEERDA